MRNRFSKILYDIAKRDDRLFLLVGDIGFNVFDDFIKTYPKQFLNAGVAESNMVGTAAGMAMNSIKPVVYTIIPFLLMRTFEQIRNDICMHNLQVTLVGVGGGLSYDTLGPTHHAIEDIAIMRSLPNMQVLTPSDPDEVEWLFPLAFKHKGPTYFRLGKGGEKNLLLDEQKATRKLGSPHEIIKGKQISIISCGPILSTAFAVRDLLSAHNINPSIISIHSIKPFNKSELIEKINDKDIIVTIEEHSTIGGLGDVVSDTLSGLQNSPIQIKFGIKDVFVKEVGSRDYQLDTHGLSPIKIVKEILEKLRSSK